jgi:hypothetical protein
MLSQKIFFADFNVKEPTIAIFRLDEEFICLHPGYGLRRGSSVANDKVICRCRSLKSLARQG